LKKPTKKRKNCGHFYVNQVNGTLESPHPFKAKIGPLVASSIPQKQQQQPALFLVAMSNKVSNKLFSFCLAFVAPLQSTLLSTVTNLKKELSKPRVLRTEG